MTPPEAPLSKAPLVINGWSLFAHPLFLDQLDGLIEEVETRRARDPNTWQKKNCTKRLAAILKLITEAIPADPTAPQFRQGNSLGADNWRWFRAKFFQQFRLFFRFDRASKIIVVAWVNDEATLRAYGSKADAYATFKAMLDTGNPPGDFDALLREAVASTERFDAGIGVARRQNRACEKD